MNSTITPINNLNSQINKLIESTKNKKTKILFKEFLENKNILKYLEEILISNYKEHNEYPLLTLESVRKLLEDKFPEEYKRFIEKFIIFKKYRENDIEKAEEILKSGKGLIYCLKTLRSRHIREAEILLLLIISGISTGFRNRELSIHLMAVGQSGKGKSASMTTASKIFSNTQLINSSSAKSQFYKAQSGNMIDNGILIYDEAENSKEGIALERVYTDKSSRIPSHETVKPNTHEFIKLEIKEINVVWRNSISTPDDNENQLSNRYLIYNVDESIEQDNLVYDSIIESFGMGKTEDNYDINIAKIITDLIKEIPYRIFIPFNKQITSDNKSNRRSIQKFLSLLWSITYINRYQREFIGEYIISTIEDFEIAKLVWNKINQSEAMQLPNKYIRILSILSSKSEMEVKEISQHPDINYSESKVRRLLKEMKDKGYVDYEKKFDRTTKHYWRAFQEVSRVFIDFSKSDFKIETLRVQLNELKQKTINLTFQNIKYGKIIDDININDLYNKILNISTNFEILKNLIEENNKFESKSPKFTKDQQLKDEKLMKNDEKCRQANYSNSNNIEVINLG